MGTISFEVHGIIEEEGWFSSGLMCIVTELVPVLVSPTRHRTVSFLVFMGSCERENRPLGTGASHGSLVLYPA